jgi:ribosomal-protein-alanine N-acetyltransferase
MVASSGAAWQKTRIPLGNTTIYLRPPHADDKKVFLKQVAASRALHRPFVTPPSNLSAFSAYLERCGGRDFVGLFACRKEDDALVGVFNLSQIFLGAFRSAYLGYYAFVPFCGQGYMTTGLKLVLRHAFLRLKLHRIEANLQPQNLASRALVVRCGFRQEGYSPRYLKIAGRWRDHERWAILKEDWQTV